MDFLLLVLGLILLALSGILMPHPVCMFLLICSLLALTVAIWQSAKRNCKDMKETRAGLIVLSVVYIIMLILQFDDCVQEYGSPPGDVPAKTNSTESWNHLID